MPARSVRLIESPHNDTMKDLRRLLTAKGIRERERALVGGGRIARDVLERHPARCLGVVAAVGQEMPPLGELSELVEYRLAPPLFRELDVTGTDRPLLLVSAPRPEAWDPEAPPAPGCTLLVPFQDPENVGAVIRTAAAFGVERVVVLAEGSNPYLPKAIRASAGAVFSVRLMEGPSIQRLPERAAIVALSGEGTDIAGFEFPPAFALLPGLEGPGLPETWRRRAVSVPHRGEVESLNAAAATAVALYLWSATAAGAPVPKPRAAPAPRPRPARQTAPAKPRPAAPTGSPPRDRKPGEGPRSAPRGTPRGTRGSRAANPKSRRPD